MYTIKEMANLSQTSTRTLRYYDEIGLLVPDAYSEAGYRLYGENSVDILQQIMFYKLLGLSLKEIQQIIYSEQFDLKSALLQHRSNLEAEMTRIRTLLHTIDKTMANMEGKGKMKVQEKFHGFKKAMLDENERQFGKEAREKFGEHVDQANEKFMDMSQSTYNEHEKLTDEMHQLFKTAYEKRDPRSTEAQQACALHQKWIKHYWSHYTEEAHMGLVNMYVADERFTAYYDEIAEGLAVFIRDAMKVYLGVGN